MNRVLIEGDVHVGEEYAPVNTIWDHDPDDPLVIRVHFSGHDATWELSLEMFREVFTPPVDGLYGMGDVRVEVCGPFTWLHLTNGMETASIQFITLEIKDFVDQVDDQGVEELISRELDEFLSQL